MIRFVLPPIDAPLVEALDSSGVERKATCLTCTHWERTQTGLNPAHYAIGEC